jgi:hypothetical protein
MARNLSVIFLCGLLSLGRLAAQDAMPGNPAPLFRSEEPLQLYLKADFKTVFSVKDDTTYFPAELTLTGDSGGEKTMGIEIRTRGVTRRKSDVCRFPPLRLEFPKKETKNTPFEGQKALKLVTHCDNAGHYEQNTILEYLIYKSYNILTDSSFNVRPAILGYIYPDREADTIRKFGFFLEREKYLAERLQGIELETEKVHPDRTDPYQTCLVDMFQYMIGNTDYSLYELHNVIFVSDSAGRLPLVPIPYDFDWSGLVSAIYAVPNPKMNTAEVTDRIYRGLKREPEVVNRVIGLFNARQQEIYQLFENYSLLDKAEKKKAIGYLDQFYDIIKNERSVQTVFFDNARN